STSAATPAKSATYSNVSIMGLIPPETGLGKPPGKYRKARPPGSHRPAAPRPLRHQERAAHRPLALDLDLSPGFGDEFLAEMGRQPVGDLDPIRQSMALHTAGGVD